MSNIEDRIRKTLKYLRENRSSSPPEVKVDRGHVVVGDGGGKLQKNFRSSGASEDANHVVEDETSSFVDDAIEKARKRDLTRFTTKASRDGNHMKYRVVDNYNSTLEGSSTKRNTASKEDLKELTISVFKDRLSEVSLSTLKKILKLVNEDLL